MASPSAVVVVVVVVVVFGCFTAVSAKTGVLFSSLEQTLVVSATTNPGDVLTAGEDKLVVSWRLNETLSSSSPSIDDGYEKVKIRLCYAPESQIDRAWRKTEDDLHRDKTCQFGVTERPYSPATARKANGETFRYHIPREIPTAVFFIRAYAFDSDGRQVAYGQSTDRRKNQNLLKIEGITGHHASIDIAAAVFSAFSVGSFVALYLFEKMKKNK